MGSFVKGGVVEPNGEGGVGSVGPGHQRHRAAGLDAARQKGADGTSATRLGLDDRPRRSASAFIEVLPTRCYRWRQAPDSQ